MFEGVEPQGWYNEATGQWDKPEPDMPQFMHRDRLTVELVPKTAWWSNVRSNVSKADWEKCKKYAKNLTGSTCKVCGQNGIEQGWRYPVEAHEIWAYDDEYDIFNQTGKQTLVDIWPLCPLCHKVKHLGRTRATSSPKEWERVIDHLALVNNWPGWKLEKYVSLQFEIYRVRSTMTWALDINFLNDVIGLGIGQTFFPPEVRA